MKLSPHFTLDEFTYSETAEKLGIINNPHGIHIENMTRLCLYVLEPVRKHFGKPVKISSGYRSPALNDELRRQGKASKNSQHMLGEAADFEISGVDNADIWRWIDENLEFDQLIAERLSENDGAAGWIHVSYNYFNNRNEALSCPVAGKYVDGLLFKEEV